MVGRGKEGRVSRSGGVITTNLMTCEGVKRKGVLLRHGLQLGIKKLKPTHIDKDDKKTTFQVYKNETFSESITIKIKVILPLVWS